jgi:hypothetical protein
VPPLSVRRFAPVFLLAAAAAATYFLVPNVPKERTLLLEVEAPASVTGVDATWSPANGGDAVQGGTWRFVAGTAPLAISSVVRLPDGRYALDVTLQRDVGREAFHRVITLGDADRVTVRLR